MKHVYLLVVILLFSGLNAQEKYTVYFDTDDDTPGKISLEAFRQWLTKNKDIDITQIYAYADSIGKIEYNFALSQRRLINVRKIIKAADIIVKKPHTKAYGEEKSTSGLLAENRRVDIFYKKRKPATAKQLEKAVRSAKKGDKT